MRGLLLVAVSVVVGCTAEPQSDGYKPPCPDGGALHSDGELKWCAWSQTSGAVQENGFMCPPEMAFAFEGGGEFICASAEGGMPGWEPVGEKEEAKPVAKNKSMYVGMILIRLVAQGVVVVVVAALILIVLGRILLVIITGLLIAVEVVMHY